MWLAPIISRMAAVLALIASVSAWVTSILVSIALVSSRVVSPFLGSFSLGTQFFPQEFQHLLYIHLSFPVILVQFYVLDRGVFKFVKHF
jgi:hypothetical protein